MEQEIKDLIQNSWKDNQSRYFDRAAEEVGIWVPDYERHPDTGQILADVGYYSNEEEIEEKAKELFLDDLFENELKDKFFELL